MLNVDPKMTKAHTLVIPTFNRPTLLKRLVQYLRDRGSPMNLLVLDSSKAEVAERNAKVLSVVGKSVRHVVFPETEPPSSKLSHGLDLVQTPYVSFCADDDLVFPERLREAVKLLETHSDYVCAHGLYLNFRQTGGNVHLTIEYAGPSNEATYAGARIFRLCQKYGSLFYATFRTPDARDIFSTMAAVPSFHFQELFQSVAALIKGKVRRFPNFYAARQSGPLAEPGREKWQPFHWFADNPAEILDHYRAYRGELWKFYETHGPASRLDKQAFFKTLDLAHAVYFSEGCPSEYFHSVLQQYWPGDSYSRIGRLDALRVVDKLLVLKQAVFPSANLGADLLDQLRTPADLPTWAAAGGLAALRYLWQIACSGPGLARLNHDVKKACRTPWKCHLPVNLRWLPAVPDFRNTYLELCYYLDQS